MKMRWAVGGLFLAGVAATLSLPSLAVGATEVAGVIEQDTRWTVAGSPYEGSDDVQVAGTAVLTIEPGVTINHVTFLVWGKLEASGQKNAPIDFTDSAIYLQTENAAATIQHAYFTGQMQISNGGQSWGGSLTLVDSIFEGGTGYCAPEWFTLRQPARDSFIERNIFANMPGVGVLDTAYGQGTIYFRNNVIYNSKPSEQANCRYGFVGGWGDKLIVTYNSFLSPVPGYLYVPSCAQTLGNNYWQSNDRSLVETVINTSNESYDCTIYLKSLPILPAPHPDTPSLYAELVAAHQRRR